MKQLKSYSGTGEPFCKRSDPFWNDTRGGNNVRVVAYAYGVSDLYRLVCEYKGKHVDKADEASFRRFVDVYWHKDDQGRAMADVNPERGAWASDQGFQKDHTNVRLV